MNRGTFRGSPPIVGDYQGLPNNGSWGGNRGRIQLDEYRALGVQDGQRNWLAVAGGARVMNTNCQQGVGNVFIPGDLGMVFNALSGTLVVNGVGVPPFAALFNSSGRVRCANPVAGTTVVENNTIVDNVPGIAVAGLMGLQGMTSTTFYIANGAACSLANNPQVDISSGPYVGTFNSGTLTASIQGFESHLACGTGATITNRTAYAVTDVVAGGASSITTGGAGTVTNQYGVDIPLLTFAGTLNTPIRIGQGGQTLTALVNSNGLIDTYTGTTTLNVASGALPTILNFGGTVSLTQSGQALGMLGCFNVHPTVTNTVGSTVSYGPVLGLVFQPTITANTQTISSGATHTGYLFSPTTSRSNAGTLSGVTFVGTQTQGTVGAGTTVTLYQGVNVVAPTISGTVTTFVGVDIAAVTGAGTNIGIRNASSLRQQGAMIATNNVVTVTSNAGTVAVTNYLSTFTNSSAATMAITMAVTGAVDGQIALVRIYDFSAVTQTIGWTNTENGGAAVPLTSNGSTTLPVTVGFIFNGSTSKWRCVAVA